LYRKGLLEGKGGVQHLVLPSQEEGFLEKNVPRGEGKVGIGCVAPQEIERTGSVAAISEGHSLSFRVV